jgi:dehydrogenase/reductase SDR family protein 12
MSNLLIPGLSGLVGVVKFPGIFFSFSRLGYRSRAAKFDNAEADIAGKTVLITGANSGLGLAASEVLIAQGARVLMLCRNPERGEEALRNVRKIAGQGGSAELLIADMTDMDSIRRVAESLPDGPLHALVHNAGSLNAKRVVTEDGLEFDFALHVAGPHLLTKLLASALRKTQGRVIFVASGGMYSERFSLEANDWEGRPYDGVKAYAQAKRTQVVLTSLWDKHETNISSYAMHPGWVDTPGVSTALPRFYKRLRRWLRTPKEGADTIVWLATTAPEPSPSGTFWLDREAVSPYMLPYTREAADAPKQLWETLEAIAER